MAKTPSSAAELTTFEHRLRSRLIAIPRRAKQAILLSADAAGLLSCVILASWLLVPGQLSVAELTFLATGTYVVTTLVATRLGFYHSIVRYLGMGLVLASAKVVLISAGTLAALGYFSNLVAMQGRLAIIYAALFLIYLLGGRYSAQYFLIRRNTGRERVIIYGAGEAGAQTAVAMQSGDTYLPVALVDDDASLVGKMVSGLKVHSPGGLPELIGQFAVSRVLLAMPTVSRYARRSIITKLEPLSVHIQTIPDFNDLVTGKAKVDDIQDVDVMDLLGRETVPPDNALLSANVSDKTVMVTGAGGSIGSELSRQILVLRPERLILFELSEAALYSIEQDIRKLSKRLDVHCDIVALLGSVHHEHRIREVMQTFGVNTVYHAAAYKHVPIVEHNILEGMHNNVFGTLHTALAAVESNVETFVLISTDKAVSPTNVMGATKRIAEMTLQALQDQHPGTRLCMVRFGNVLESSGSVVPLFREQIRAGGPVTVTHREITRYFMTIPEAAQLVIQAGAMAQGGDVFVLDMGEPVKILDLAHRMIHLMGLDVRDENNPEGDIELEYTGLRPAEKLYEELLIGSNVSGTDHARIMRANEEYLKQDELEPLLERLLLASARLDRELARQTLLDIVEGYAPSNGIDDHVWNSQNRRLAETRSDSVVDFPERSA